MILAQVLGLVCYKQGKVNMLRCTDARARARARTASVPNKHTPPRADFSSSCSFLLGTLKPVRVSPCPSLARLCPPPLPPPTLLFHFVCSLPPFHNPLNMSEPSFHRVTYQIFHHVTANKVKCGARVFSPTPFSSFSACCVTAAAVFFCFFFISPSPACNLAVTPDPFIFIFLNQRFRSFQTRL